MDLNNRVDARMVTEISKGHKSVKTKVELCYLFSPHCLIMLYICTKYLIGFQSYGPEQ